MPTRITSFEARSIRSANRFAVLYYPNNVDGHQYSIAWGEFSSTLVTYATRDRALAVIRRQRSDLSASDIPTLDAGSYGAFNRLRNWFTHGIVVVEIVDVKSA